MATNTKTQRKAAGQKAAATRKRNTAKRQRSARKAAETRAKAEANTLQSLAYKGQEVGQRAVDAGKSVTGAGIRQAKRVGRETERRVKSLR